MQHAWLHLYLVDEYVCPQLQADNSLAACPADVPYELAWDTLAAAALLGGMLALRRRPVTSL